MVRCFKIVFTTLLLLNFPLSLHCAELPAGETGALKPGDKVGIQFACRFPNGDIAASSSTTVAKDSTLRKSSVYLPRSTDDPVEVTVGQRQGKNSFPIPFEEAVIDRIALSLAGTAVGKTRTIEISSERPANVPEKEQFLELARVKQRPKEIRMTRDEFKSRTGKDAEVGAEYALDPVVPGKVASVSENEVLIRFSAQLGSEVETPFGKGTIRENGNQVEIVIDAVKGTLVRTGPIVGRISDVQDKMFTIDFGNPFGGEPLMCEVRTEGIPENKLPKKEK